MPLERKEPIGGGDNSAEIAEEEARVNHGGPIQSRRKTGKLAPELGKDYVPFDQTLHQERSTGDDIGFSADSQDAIGEDEIIEAIDEKIRREKTSRAKVKPRFKEGTILDWHNAKAQEKMQEYLKNPPKRRQMPSQFSPLTDKEKILNLKSGRGSQIYRKDSRWSQPHARQEMIEKKREMTHRAKISEKNRILRDQLTVTAPKVEL